MELSCQSSGTVKRLILKQLFLIIYLPCKRSLTSMGSFCIYCEKDFFSMKSSRLFFLLILFIINCFILVWLIQDRSHVSGLTATTCNSDEFREQFLVSISLQRAVQNNLSRSFICRTSHHNHARRRFFSKKRLSQCRTLSEIQKGRISSSEKIL